MYLYYEEYVIFTRKWDIVVKSRPKIEGLRSSNQNIQKGLFGGTPRSENRPIAFNSFTKLWCGRRESLSHLSGDNNNCNR